MNQWETLLRTWAPRRPSARLEHRLFDERPAATQAAQPSKARTGGLVPSVQCSVSSVRRPLSRLRSRFTFHALRNTEQGTRNTEQRSPRFRLSWLAPATAALLLTCVLFNPRNGATLASSANSGPMVAMIMSNQSAAAYLPGSFKREQNTLGNTFEWTNHRSSISSVPSLSGSRGKN